MFTVVQRQAVSGQTTADIEARFGEKAAQLRSRVAEKIADDIVDFSPVSTGTYIMAHVAGVDESGEAASRSSADKPRGRSKAQFAALARHNLRRSVSARAIMGSREIWFRNRALHAKRVEELGWEDLGSQRGPYRVYASARARADKHIRDAASELGFETR